MPDLGGNAIVPNDRDLPFASFFDWPTGPSWLYALTQGLHTNVGLVVIPFLLAKLWSVIPRLFEVPPFKTPAQLVERLSIALLVSSAVFELATGVCNALYWYPFKFNFVVAHYYGAIVFVASLALHVDREDAGDPARLPRARRAQAAAGQPGEHAARAVRGTRLHESGGADAFAPRPVRLRRRGRADAAGGERRPVRRRAAAQARLPRAAARDRGRRLPGQQDRGRAPA